MSLFWTCLVLCFGLNVCSMNIAFNKPTQVINIRHFADPSWSRKINVVDGRNCTKLEDGCCVHTITANSPWWYVDLEEESVITKLIIYFRRLDANGHCDRCTGFRLYSSNNVLPPSFNAQPFYIRNKSVPDANIAIPTRQRGRYISYQLPGSVDLILCEVIVIGCPVGKYGRNCSRTCPSFCKDNACDPDSGVCWNGCVAGKQGLRCEQNCTDGSYGLNCTRRCGMCYTKNPACNNINGYCPVNSSLPLCEKGFREKRCKQNCTNNAFGYDCRHRCYCNVGSCDTKNGICDTLGCKPGYQLVNCSIPCNPGRYGQDCAFTCGHCLNGTCDPTTGTCRGGCQLGYKSSDVTQKCDLECPDGTFGELCKDKCGKCHESYPCNKQNGICPERKFRCVAGYMGPQCNEECTANTFGEDCRHRCHCREDGCSSITGICQSSDCEVGYQLSNCSITCFAGTFGENCTSLCGNCRGGTGNCNPQNGTCLYGCAQAYTSSDNFTRCDIELSQEHLSDDPSSTALIGGVVGTAILFVACLIVAIVVYRRIKTSSRNKLNKESNQLHFDDVKNNDQTSADNTYAIVNKPNRKQDAEYAYATSNTCDDEEENTYANEENTYYNSTAVGISIDQLHLVLNNLAKDDNAGYKQEFKGIPYGDIHPSDISKTEINMPKNRYKTVFAYNHSRVILQRTPTAQNATDYINANFIDGMTKEKEYIACQGPRKNTVADHWHMIWENNIGKIVMLANVVEMGKNKLEPYWPQGDAALDVEDFRITKTENTECTFFAKKTLLVLNKKTNESRSIQHLHFTVWPDHGAPNAIQLLLFYMAVNRSTVEQSRPLLVHCSAGVGRTGTFIGIDALLQYGKQTGKVDIKGYVKLMRKDRMNMVQTVEQYIVLHKVLQAAFNTPNDTTLNTDSFSSTLQRMLNTKAARNQSQLHQQFQELQKMKHIHDDSEYKQAMSEENTTKIGESGILPLDAYRVFLSTGVARHGTFINAVALPSTCSNKEYIVTCYPMPNTTLDFWRLVHDSMIENAILVGTPRQIMSWNVELVEEYFQIDIQDAVKSEGVISSDVKVILKGTDNESDVTFYSLDTFDIASSKSKSQLLSLFEKIDDNQNKESTSPHLVICPDGSSDCGVVCSILESLKKIQVDNEVNIFNIVRLLRTRRPEFITSFEQYRFIHEVLAEYVENRNTYANV